jgi:midasin (ATPase involved in ribosome maturation)
MHFIDSFFQFSQVGPTRSGKTSIVKLLAELTGHPLKIMTVSPEMDTIELLGGFEQVRLIILLFLLPSKNIQFVH